MARSKTPLTHFVRLSETARIHAVGNSVVPLVAKAFLTPPRRSKRRRESDDEERLWADPWEESAAKRQLIADYASEIVCC